MCRENQFLNQCCLLWTHSELLVLRSVIPDGYVEFGGKRYEVEGIENETGVCNASMRKMIADLNKRVLELERAGVRPSEGTVKELLQSEHSRNPRAQIYLIPKSLSVDWITIFAMFLAAVLIPTIYVYCCYKKHGDPRHDDAQRHLVRYAQGVLLDTRKYNALSKSTEANVRPRRIPMPAVEPTTPSSLAS